MRKFVFAAVLCGAWSTAHAQSSPGWTYGQVPTPAQWNGAFAAKQDYLGASPLLITGGTLSGRLITAAPSSTLAGLNLTPGSAPSAPADGDLWFTASGVFARVNGVTVGPLSSGAAASFAATTPLSVSFPAGVTTYACATCGITSNPLSQFAATTSAQLRGVMSDETGTGALVFAGGAIGAATGTSLALGGASIGSNALATTGSSQLGGAVTVTSNSGAAFAVGANGGTNAAFSVDASASSVATGLRVQGLAAGNGINLQATSSATNEALGINAKGSGILALGAVSTGQVQIGGGGGGVQIGSALTYGGVTLNNAVAGTGNLVASVSPSLSTPTIAGATLSGTFAGTPAFSGANFITLGNIAQNTTAWSFLGNATSGTANNAPFTIGGLTAKSSPASTDLLMLSDQAASGALKQATIAQVVGSLASGVSSIDSKTGAFTTGNGIDTSVNVIELTAARRTLPTTQVFLSGSGTYTTPSNVLWLEIEMVGGGAGGAGSGSTGATFGTNGGNSTFSTFTAGGGNSPASQSSPGNGGTASGGYLNQIGGSGGAGSSVTTPANGPIGGSSPFGGFGQGGAPGAGAGSAATTNSGSGGGGGGINTTAPSGAGGGSGGYLKGIIQSPSATYSYAVGAAGGGGSAGSGGAAGGAGAAGRIMVIEHYGS
ncbi:hypothetical protein IC762_17850 [Bradyrhizobium genosp. L]|uniref:hypothetical protein n=1 Tax=Bradyrhizobium genosp. L TaxID=83637 RepID=UPI0018A2BD12|nr:hypothetical protein [Bradyrhizobium genosp. L]QPF81687.1 hypothetical protein IC762_17850 [Bradyrhizobium genosp. L]